MLNRRLLGRGMSERCERVFQQTTTNSDVATNRCHDDAARPLVGAVLGVFSVILKWQVSGQIKKKNSFLIFGRRGRSFMQWVWPSIPTATRGGMRSCRLLQRLGFQVSVFMFCLTFNYNTTKMYIC